MSQTVSAFTYLENVRSNIYDDKCTPKGYYPQKLWFDMTNGLTILSIMYPIVFFCCYSKVNNNVHIYKFNEAENKTILNGKIYIHLSMLKFVFKFYTKIETVVISKPLFQKFPKKSQTMFPVVNIYF